MGVSADIAKSLTIPATKTMLKMALFGGRVARTSIAFTRESMIDISVRQQSWTKNRKSWLLLRGVVSGSGGRKVAKVGSTSLIWRYSSP